MKSVSRTKDGAGGVTSAQALPMRNSSHCIAAGTLAAVFCRRLKRSIVNPSVPDQGRGGRRHGGPGVANAQFIPLHRRRHAGGGVLSQVEAVNRESVGAGGGGEETIGRSGSGAKGGWSGVD